MKPDQTYVGLTQFSRLPIIFNVYRLPALRVLLRTPFTSRSIDLIDKWVNENTNNIFSICVSDGRVYYDCYLLHAVYPGINQDPDNLIDDIELILSFETEDNERVAEI